MRKPRHFGHFRRQPFEQIRQGVAQAEVAAVIRAVLRNEHDLAHPFGGESPRFGDDVVGGRAVQLALHLRDDAEGTRGVAAVGDFEVRARPAAKRGLRDIERRLFERDGDDGLRIGADAVPVLGAEHGVDLRHLRTKLLAVECGQAAGDDKLLASALLGGEFENRVDRLLLRGVDEAAGIDDDDVGGGRLRHFKVGAIAEHAGDAFAIRDVLRAAECDDVVAHGVHGS